MTIITFPEHRTLAKERQDFADALSRTGFTEEQIETIFELTADYFDACAKRMAEMEADD